MTGCSPPAKFHVRRAAKLTRSFSPDNAPADCCTIQEEQVWLEPQVENIYYHERPAIQEHNVSADEDVLAIRRRRRQLPFKIDGNSINPSP
jgi:hypothetical protein